MEYKIKVLKDTPFHKKDDLISIKDFKEVYNYVSSKYVKDEELINYLIKEYQLEQECLRYGIGTWFQVIEDDSFKVGDWVWNENMKKAYFIVKESYKGWKPNECTINAVNENLKVYKRKATQEEIDCYNLESFCNGKVLIGKYLCYYFDNVWKPLTGVRYNIEKYLQISKELTDVYTFDSTWKSKLNGLKVGCTEISHEDILKIAKILKLV